MTTKGRQTSVSTTQDIANDKKHAELTLKSTKEVDSIHNTNHAKTENMQFIDVTDDNFDKMTGSTNDNIKDLSNTIRHMGNTKTDNLQSK